MAASTFRSAAFNVDLDAVALDAWVTAGGRGEEGPPPPRARTPGLVLVAAWGWAAEPGGIASENAASEGATSSPHARAYAQLSAQIHEASRGALYVYPAHATHITVAL
jgi:hypothetical protein